MKARWSKIRSQQCFIAGKVIRRIEATVANSDDDHSEFQNSPANPRGNVTIFDVAEKAGVSFVSVSRVFNGHANVSDKMRKRVLEAARAVGYQPRTSVRAGIIAVLVQEEYDKNLQLDKYQLCGHLFFAAANQGYFIEVVPVRRIQMLTQHLVNGVIELDCSSERLYAFQELNKIPVILTQRATHQPRWGSVSIDYVFEARIALQQLLDLGHKKITVFVDRPRHTANQQRLEGMQVLLEQRGLPPRHPRSAGTAGTPSARHLQSCARRAIHRTPELSSGPPDAPA